MTTRSSTYTLLGLHLLLFGLLQSYIDPRLEVEKIIGSFGRHHSRTLVTNPENVERVVGMVEQPLFGVHFSEKQLATVSEGPQNRLWILQLPLFA